MEVSFHLVESNFHFQQGGDRSIWLPELSPQEKSEKAISKVLSSVFMFHFGAPMASITSHALRPASTRISWRCLPNSDS